jgi:hypothetical protein
VANACNWRGNVSAPLKHGMTTLITGAASTGSAYRRSSRCGAISKQRPAGHLGGAPIRTACWGTSCRVGSHLEFLRPTPIPRTCVRACRACWTRPEIEQRSG